MSKRKTTKEFIMDSIKIHGNKYNYDKVDYKNNYTKISIICDKHGIFEQTPKNHLNKKQGCPDCSGNRCKDNSKFIKDAILVHGDRYNYDKVHYISNKVNVTITCKLHGDFQQTPDAHLNQNQDCPSCSGNKRKNTLQFIEEASKIHDNLYDYSLVEYINNMENVIIICKKHGNFKQAPINHINGKKGCPTCRLSKGELSIIRYLNENNILFIQQKKFKKCRNKRELPFDFYLPYYNMCIEYDGEQHFKCVEFFGGEKSFLNRLKNDDIKNSFCKENGINILRIAYKDYERISEIIKGIKI